MDFIDLIFSKFSLYSIFKNCNILGWIFSHKSSDFKQYLALVSVWIDTEISNLRLLKINTPRPDLSKVSSIAYFKSSMFLDVSECKQPALLWRSIITTQLFSRLQYLPPLPSSPSSENFADQNSISNYINSSLECASYYHCQSDALLENFINSMLWNFIDFKMSKINNIVNL